MASRAHYPRLLVLVALAAGSAAGGATLRGVLVVEDFEAFAWGGDWATLHCTEGADPRMLAEGQTTHSGQQAARLEVPPGESLTLVAQHGTGFTPQGQKRPLPLPGVPERVGLWVFGRASGHRLSLRLADAKRKTAEVALGAVDFEGWRRLDARVPSLTPPVGLKALTVRGGAGPLVLDDVTVVTGSEHQLHLTVQPAYRRSEPVDDWRVQFRVVVQSLGPAAVEGRCQVAAFPVGAPKRPSDRTSFWFEVERGQPVSETVRLDLRAGVYRLVAVAGDAETERRIVVFPSGGEETGPSPWRAIRGFDEREDELWVYQSALSPAVVVESRGETLTLFQGLPAVGLSAPQDSLMRVKKRIDETGMKRELLEPWLLVWFGSAPLWYRVTVADGSPCPTFDVPFLVVLEHKPEEVALDEGGLRLAFGRRAGRVAVMPLYGVHRPSPSQTTRWREEVEPIRRVVSLCRWWARALRAYPIRVEPSWRIDPEADTIEVRLKYSYLWWPGDWDSRPLKTAPVPPLLALAAQAGFPVRFETAPRATRCYSAVGPWMAVPETDELRYTIHGVLGHVNQALGEPGSEVPLRDLGLAAKRKSLADDVAKMPFWPQALGDRGRLVAEGVLRTMLWEGNARYERDSLSGRVRAVDGLAWQVQGDRAAAAAVSEHLRGCWFAARHAALDEPIEAHWHHLAALRETLRQGGAWGTIGLGTGGPSLDARLNAEAFFARLAARFGRGGDYRDACGRLAHLLAAGHALAAGARDYADAHKPWATLAGRPQDDAVLGRCLDGSLGLAPGPPPFVTRPSDAGYAYASRELSRYFQERFRPGPFGFYGESPAAWRQRERRAIDLPPLRRRFYEPPAERAPFAGNHCFAVNPGPDGWPTLAWASHRAPKGGPLVFGSFRPATGGTGTRLRTRDVSPYLRLSAYGTE
ncbi:MAG: flagellar filament outer layer protein FlaA [bacterium]